MTRAGTVDISEAVRTVDERLAACEVLVGKSRDEYPRSVLSQLAQLQSRVNVAKTHSPELAQMLKEMDAMNLVAPVGPELLAVDEAMPASAMLEVALAAQDDLTWTLGNLQQIEALQHVLDMPSLQQLPALVSQFTPIETVHIEQCKAYEALNQRVLALVEAYASFVDSVNEIFVDMDGALGAAEKRLQQRERQRRQQD
ncbi:hypothetical protein RI367_000714 [Sorochytrium milnesiophthora]